MKKLLLLTAFYLVGLVGLQAQTEEDTPDKKSNIQLFTPSALFGKGQFEINNFNNKTILLYSKSIVVGIHAKR